MLIRLCIHEQILHTVHQRRHDVFKVVHITYMYTDQISLMISLDKTVTLLFN